MNIGMPLGLAAALFMISQTAIQAADPAPAGAAVAAQAGKPVSTQGIAGAQSDQPVDISSDEAHVSETDRIVVLKGNVIAKQGEVTLQADTVTVHYLPGAEDAGNSRGKIDRLDASGNVVVTRPGEVVKGDAATYKMIDRQILMKGNVVATRAGNVVRGDSLTVDLVKETIRLQANPQNGRVRAIFTPPPSGAKP